MEHHKINPATGSDTICAIATPPGIGGIAVVRISGPQAIEIADKVWKGQRLKATPSHTARYGEVTTFGPEPEPLDTALATVFRAPHSYTGENTVELSVHGSRYIQQALVDTLVEAGCRPAGPGEFTRRAFVNGRLDLAEAEAVADIIAAESGSAATIALTQLKGSYSRQLTDLRQNIIDIMALVELELDFSDQDVEFASTDRITAALQATIATLETLKHGFRSGSAIKNGVPTTIIGIPNAGKSTLLNTLLQEQRALVSPISGTTRDTIEETLTIDGILFRLIDTAGLRDTHDTIEQLGIERTIEKIKNSQIIIRLQDPTQPGDDRDTTLALIKRHASPQARIITAINKSDLVARPAATVESAADKENSIEISAKTGAGIDALRQAMVNAATAGLPGETDMIVTNARHFAAIADALDAARRALAGIEKGLGTDLIAQDLRATADSLGAITGAITTPDILSTVFSRFCVGK